MAAPPSTLIEALQDRYAIERELGRGGMATVYLARDLRHGRLVALKALRPELSAVVGRERFARETAIAAGLNHPHILALFDSGSLTAGGAEPVLYYTMPYVEGRSLRERLREEPQLSVDEAVTIARQVAEALDHAHRQGIVHRDIKPENVLLAGEHALVADFGIARALSLAGGERLTETGLSVGTPAYMSPEQAAADGRLDGRSDLYSLGCMLYEMLAGQPPFTGSTSQAILARHAVDPVPSLRTVRPTVPHALEQAVTRVLAKVPADRFATAGAFSAALARAISAPPAPTTRVARIARGSRRTWLLTAAALATAAAVVAGVATLRRSPPSPVYRPTRVVVAPIENQTGDSTVDRFTRQLLTTLPDAIAREGVGDPVPAAMVRDALARSKGSAGDVAERLARQAGAGLELRGVCTRAAAGGTICQMDLLRMPTKLLRMSVSATGDPAQPAFDAELTERVLVALLLQRSYGDQATWQGEYIPRSLAAVRAFEQGWETGNRAYFADAARLDTGWAHAAAAFAVWGDTTSGEAAESTLARLLRRPGLLSGERENVQYMSRRADGEQAYRLAERRFAVNFVWWFARLAEFAMMTDRPHRALQASRYQDTALALFGGAPQFGGSAYLMGGYALHQLGRYREELQLAHDLQHRFPELVHIYRTHEAMALAALGEVDSLHRRLAEWEATPEEGDMAGTRGFIAGLELMAHGYQREGREVLVGTLPHYRRNERGAIQEVMVLIWTDQLEDARRLALARLRTARSVADSLNYAGALGSVAAAQGARAEAARYDRLLAAERPRDLEREAVMMRAAIATHLGDREEAVRLLEKARINPDFSTTHTHLHRWLEFATLRDYPPFQRFLEPRD
jgi:serine/threonine protein kinase